MPTGYRIRSASLALTILLVQGACEVGPGTGVGGDTYTADPVGVGALLLEQASPDQDASTGSVFTTVPMFLHRANLDELGDQVISPAVGLPGLVRLHHVTANLDLMTRVLSLEPGERIAINPFHDVQWVATPRTRATDYGAARLVELAIEGSPLAFAAISVSPDGMLMEIDDPDLPFKYQVIKNAAAGTYEAREISRRDEDALPGFPVMIPDEDEDVATSEAPMAVADANPATFDVMVVYTPAAASWAADNGGISNVISQAIQRLQTSMTNSQTQVAITLVHSSEVAYTETGDTYKDLDRLNSTFDKYLKEVHTLRDTYQADLVVLLEKVEDVGGLAYLLDRKTGKPTHAFSIVRVQQASRAYTLAHELAHTVGCDHHKSQKTAPGSGLYSYSTGWRWVGNDGGRYCSVMTYESGEYFADGQDHVAVGHYSNPSVYHEGVSTGQASKADNARGIRDIKHVIAAYRRGMVFCSGKSCSVGPRPLPNSATANSPWDPCSGGAFTWTASGQLENDNDRACVGGTASAGSSGGCSGGGMLTGAGPWSGTASGTVIVSLATNQSVQSDGIVSLTATCCQCTSGACCDGCMYRPSSYSCGTAVSACSGAGICTGASADCPDAGFAARGSACDDVNACTENDQCDGVGFCSGQTVTCDDANPCTDDSCDPAVGCVFAGHTRPCDDGDVCTVSDQCDGVGDCAGIAIVCDDANPCTDDSCDPAVGCVFTNNNERPCEDSNPCNISGCSEGVCVVRGTDSNCCSSNAGCKNPYGWCDLEQFKCRQATCADLESDPAYCQERGCVDGACCPFGTAKVDGTCKSATGAEPGNGGGCTTTKGEGSPVAPLLLVCMLLVIGSWRFPGKLDRHDCAG